MAKKAAPKKSAPKKAVKAVKTPAEDKPIGAVSHFYGGIGVAIVKFNRPVKKGETVRFKGATTDFEQAVESMQFDHKDVAAAEKGQEVGVKVNDKVREGDEVYLV